jgi:hypothetical protein
MQIKNKKNIKPAESDVLHSSTGLQTDHRDSLKGENEFTVPLDLKTAPAAQKWTKASCFQAIRDADISLIVKWWAIRRKITAALSWK